MQHSRVCSKREEETGEAETGEASGGLGSLSQQLRDGQRGLLAKRPDV